MMISEQQKESHGSLPRSPPIRHQRFIHKAHAQTNQKKLLAWLWTTSENTYPIQTSASLQSSAINFASKDNSQLQAQDGSNQKCAYKQVLENLYDRMLFR